jgi:hypothetical protein
MSRLDLRCALGRGGDVCPGDVCPDECGGSFPGSGDVLDDHEDWSG